ncbi:hypothetical protein [Streptomyces sp. NPDC020607]|uniref:hypothetical protein n=1 Tax=Streptomyces sp. NPDC020607 TaxID=3365082 RepID=UPI00379BA753
MAADAACDPGSAGGTGPGASVGGAVELGGAVRAAPTGNSWRCGTTPGAADTSGERRVVRDGCTTGTAGPPGELLAAGAGSARAAADRCTGAVAEEVAAPPAPRGVVCSSVPAALGSLVPRTGR